MSVGRLLSALSLWICCSAAVLADPSSGAAGKELPNIDRTLYSPEEGECDIVVCVDDAGAEETVLRDAPEGRILTRFHRSSEASGRIVVRVIGFRRGWLAVSLPGGAGGWVPCGPLKVRVRNDGPGSVTALRCRPEEDAPAVIDIFNGGETTLVGGAGKWALVRYTTPAGSTATGWLDPRQADRP